MPCQSTIKRPLARQGYRAGAKIARKPRSLSSHLCLFRHFIALDSLLFPMRCQYSNNTLDRILFAPSHQERELLSQQLQGDRLVSRLHTDHHDSHITLPRHSDDSLGGNGASVQMNALDRLFLSRHTSKPVIGPRGPRRTLPAQPDRVLDAPGLIDDFYLNLIDWSVRNVVAVALGPSVYLWNAADGSVKELMTLVNAADQYVSSVCWIHDGKSVAVGLSDGLVQIWDVEKSRKLRTMIVSSESRISSLSSHRHMLSTGSRNGTVESHDVRVARHLLTRHETRGPHEVCGLRWSPDGQQLAGGANDNSVYVWDMATGTDPVKPRFHLEGHRSAVKALAWCPWKTHTLATGGGSQDKSIRLWDTSSGSCVASVDAGSAVSSLLWSRSSRELVSAHGLERNHIALWNVDISARSLAHLDSTDHAHDGRILNMCLSPDAKTVVTASADESLKFWPLFPAPLSLGARQGKNFPNPLNSASPDSPFSLSKKSLR